NRRARAIHLCLLQVPQRKPSRDDDETNGPDRKESIWSQRAGLGHGGEVRASYALVSRAGDAAETAGDVVVTSIAVQLIEGDGSGPQAPGRPTAGRDSKKL